MAFLEERNGRFRLKFHFEGQYHSRSLKTTNEQKAELAKGQVERNLELVSLGLLRVPQNCDVFGFFLTRKASPPDTNAPKEKPPGKKRASKLSIGKLFRLYFDDFLKESVEQNSFKTLKTHRNNLLRLIGRKTSAKSFGTGDIQEYIDARTKEKGKRGCIQPVTIRKEIATLSAQQLCGRRSRAENYQRMGWSSNRIYGSPVSTPISEQAAASHPERFWLGKVIARQAKLGAGCRLAQVSLGSITAWPGPRTRRNLTSWPTMVKSNR